MKVTEINASKFPGLRAAALEIAGQNGMINRFQDEETFLIANLEPVLLKPHPHDVTPEELREMDRFLSSLLEQDLAHLCVGEENQQLEIAARAGSPLDEKINLILNEIYEPGWRSDRPA